MQLRRRRGAAPGDATGQAHGTFIDVLDMPAIVGAACWRLRALATFHGGGPWQVDTRSLAEQAHTPGVEQVQLQWIDWERTSTRAGQQRAMTLGGLLGSAVLRGVPPDVRAINAAAGSLVHIGKAAVFKAWPARAQVRDHIYAQRTPR
ncbi:MAG: hypothetical protein U0Z44_20355 [Kouleothrix sp.]